MAEIIRCDQCRKEIDEYDSYYELTLVNPIPTLVDNTDAKNGEYAA